MNLLEAMALKEGFGVKGTRATRNNNPGNIEWGPFARAHGATRIEEIPRGNVSRPRFAYFPTVEAGFRAMRARLLTGIYEGLTIRQAISTWAPPSENDTEKYIQFVCEKIGAKEHHLVSEWLKEIESEIA